MNSVKLADMHTHSENSHDSNCKIEDMMQAQIKNGTNIFAVTDHFDAYRCNEMDIFTPIAIGHKTLRELNVKYGDKCKILAGIEISELFWHPEIYERIKTSFEFDVIIGSVHCVDCKYFTGVLCAFDFSTLSKSQVEEMLDIYFDDTIKMIEFMDFDILGHLTYFLRYANGKYKFGIDLVNHKDKIDKILDEIIARNIALEINTSSVDRLNDFMPNDDIIKAYYEKGGRLITLGSDAHTPSRASIDFDKAVATLKEIGFDGIYYFENRQPHKIKI